MRYILLLLALTSTCTAIDPEKGSVATEPDEGVQRIFEYLFGIDAPRELEAAVRRKLGESEEFDASMRRISDSSGSGEDDPDIGIKRMVLNVIHEALQERHLEATDARLQLQLKEKEIRQERYKFLAGCATTVTAVLGLIGTVVAYQAAGCG